MPVAQSPAELLPVTPPMILIDEVVEWNEPHVTCKLTLRPDSMFVEGRQVPALVSLEYMAQAIFALVGLVSLTKGEPIVIGYLLGTRELDLAIDHFDVGDELLLQAERLFGESALGSYRCSVTRAGEVVAKATLNVFRNLDEEVPDP
jgi:predicted hotdog family 3-hydroxylacyl-ACP dehydratase